MLLLLEKQLSLLKWTRNRTLDHLKGFHSQVVRWADPWVVPIPLQLSVSNLCFSKKQNNLHKQHIPKYPVPRFVAGHTTVTRQRCSPLKPCRYSPPQTTAAQCIRAGAQEVPSFTLSNIRVRFYNKIIQNCTKPELKHSGMAPLGLLLSFQLRLIIPASWNFSLCLEVVFLVQESNTSFLQSAERGRKSGSQPDLPKTGT